MPPAKRPHEVGQRILALVANLKVTLFPNGDLWYGDQRRLGRTPTVCVEAGDTDSPLAGVPAMVRREHECFIIVYHAELQDNQTTKLECEQFAASIADMLDANMQLTNVGGTDPLVIHGWCTSIAPGYSMKEPGTMYRATRITWQGISKTRLGA